MAHCGGRPGSRAAPARHPPQSSLLFLSLAVAFRSAFAQTCIGGDGCPTCDVALQMNSAPGSPLISFPSLANAEACRAFCKTMPAPGFPFFTYGISIIPPGTFCTCYGARTTCTLTPLSILTTGVTSGRVFPLSPPPPPSPPPSPPLTSRPPGSPPPKPPPLKPPPSRPPPPKSPPPKSPPPRSPPPKAPGSCVGGDGCPTCDVPRQFSLPPGSQVGQVQGAPTLEDCRSLCGQLANYTFFSFSFIKADSATKFCSCYALISCTLIQPPANMTVTSGLVSPRNPLPGSPPPTSPPPISPPGSPPTASPPPTPPPTPPTPPPPTPPPPGSPPPGSPPPGSSPPKPPPTGSPAPPTYPPPTPPSSRQKPPKPPPSPPPRPPPIPRPPPPASLPAMCKVSKVTKPKTKCTAFSDWGQVEACDGRWLCVCPDKKHPYPIRTSEGGLIACSSKPPANAPF